MGQSPMLRGQALRTGYLLYLKGIKRLLNFEKIQEINILMVLITIKIKKLVYLFRKLIELNLKVIK
jgi:hypothetical protein